jgi:hypothetical protein
LGIIRLRPRARQNGRLLQRIPQRFVVAIDLCGPRFGSSGLNAGAGVHPDRNLRKESSTAVVVHSRAPLRCVGLLVW